MKHLIDSKTYAFRQFRSGDEQTCECCSYPAPLTESLPGPGAIHQGHTQPFVLCKLCYHSIAGSATMAGGRIERGECISLYGANAVLDQLGSFDNNPIITYLEE